GMARLRRRILELGGIQAANSYVKINLSLFDLFPRRYCPSIPPEMALLPFDLRYQIASWARAIVVSLSIVHAANPRRPVPEGFTLDEIWLPGASPAFRKDDAWLTGRNAFLAVDGILKWWERHGSGTLRRKAMKRAGEGMIERLPHSEGLGAIYPPMMYAVMALDGLGYAESEPVRAEALRQFTRLMAREVRRKGVWPVKRPRTEPSGWAFEYVNEFYPDIDDTAMVLLALSQSAHAEPCRKRALDWTLAMQSRDGG